MAALIEDIIGLNAYMDIAAVNRLMREDDLVSQVALRVDPAQERALWGAMAGRPRVASSTAKLAWMRAFDEAVGKLVIISAMFLTGLGIIIAVGIVYNGARVALQERAWEMASLRVLGFTRAEVAGLLLTELAVATLLALPLGMLLAQGMVELIAAAQSNQSFELPSTVSRTTFAAAALIVPAAAAASAFLVRRRMDRLDLVAALKARE